MSAEMTHTHRGWIGVDFDGTLAVYNTWVAPGHTGEAIAPMVERVKLWLRRGYAVKVFTARVWPILTWEVGVGSEMLGTYDERRMRDATVAAQAIDEWCRRVFGHTLPITCVKDMAMIELWDDRAVQVVPNVGTPVGHSTRGLT